MEKLQTGIGTVYYEFNKEESCLVLCDSNKQFIGNIYIAEEEIPSKIDELINMKHPADLVDVGALESLMFARSWKELTEVINDRINEDNDRYSEEETIFSVEEIKTNDYSNRIGRNYIYTWE